MPSEPRLWETTENEWPLALTEYAQWMASKQKRPVAPWSSTPDTKYKWGGDHTHNWADFEKAQNAAEIMDSLDDALAFILQSPDDPYTTDPDPFLFFDGDNVRLPDGRVHPAYAALIDDLGETYTEASVSGGGLHSLYEGRLPEGHETGFAFDLPDHPDFPDAHVEVYHGKRVCICTGKRVTTLSGEVRSCDRDSLLGLARLVDASPERSGDPAPQTTLTEQRDAQNTRATRDFDVVRAAIDGLTVDDVRLRSTKTAERSDGSLDYDPSFARSESGKRLGIDGGQVVYRDGNHGGDILSLVAWEEGIIDPGDRLAGKDFWDAVRAARDRGAPIPAYHPGDDDQNNNVVHQPNEDVITPDRPAGEADAVTGDDDENEAAGDPDTDTETDEPAPPNAAQRGPSWEQVRIYFDDEDIEQKDARRDLVAKLCADHHWMVHEDNPEQLYWYNPDEGIYQPHGDARIGELLERELKRHHTKRLYGEVRHRVRQRNWVPREDVGGTLDNPLVCVENGVVNLANGDVTDHSPDLPFIAKVHAPYDPDADCPEFDAFLESVVDTAQSKRLVYQLIAHAIHPGYVEDGFCVFYGDGQNGKSTLLEAMRRFLGPENVAARNVQDFEHDEFATGTLYGKMANFGGDLPNEALVDTGMLKKLSAGDSITYNAKRQSQFTFQSEATLVFAANDPPAIADDSKAIYRRLLMVNFPNEFTPVNQPGPDQEPQQDIFDRILTDEERAGILNRAIEEARALRADGFAFSMSVQEKSHQYKKISEPVYRFVSEALEHVQDGDMKNDWIATEELYAAFVEWCRENDTGIKDKNVFIREMKRFIGGKLEKGNPSRGGRQVPGYYPLAFTGRGRQLAGLDKPSNPDGQTGLDVR